MTIQVGTLCFISGITRQGNGTEHLDSNGHVVTVTSPPMPRPNAEGGFAHAVAAPWIAALEPTKTLYVVPRCLIPITPPDRSTTSHRPETQDA